MPKYVDHHARRQLVTEVAAEIVAARGVEALTVRGVAAATGFSTAVVSHYFARQAGPAALDVPGGGEPVDRAVRVRGGGRSAQCGELPGVAAAPRRDSRRDWRVFVAFWGTAASDEELADRAAGPGFAAPAPGSSSCWPS